MSLDTHTHQQLEKKRGHKLEKVQGKYMEGCEKRK